MNYQKIVLVGNATADARRQKSKKGTSYTTFSVAVSNARKQGVFFPVAVFGKSAEPAAKYITKGRQVLVEGRVELGANNRLTVIADQVRFGPGRKPKPAVKSK